jgi:metallopeptidase MepB
VALSRSINKLLLAAVALFISLAAILASLRLGVRPPSLIQYLKPSPLRTPFSQAFRPLTNSSMAPKQYKTPPQLPPKFTATTQSLIDDTKKLVCCRHGERLRACTSRDPALGRCRPKLTRPD